MRSLAVFVASSILCVSLISGCGPAKGSGIVDQSNVTPDPNVDPNTAKGEGYKDPLAAE